MRACVRACMRACVRVCARARACVCVCMCVFVVVVVFTPQKISKLAGIIRAKAVCCKFSKNRLGVDWHEDEINCCRS